MENKPKWEDRWFHNVPKVISNTLKEYGEIGKNPIGVTACQVLREREWDLAGRDIVSLKMAIEEMGILFIPTGIDPGPMFLFPEYDIDQEPRRAQTKPLYPLLPNSKYVTIGERQETFLGPVWLGNRIPTLQKILDKRAVVICEGPFDLLGLRVASEFPSLSSLTKKISKDHVDYLKVLGTKKIYLMFDNETSLAGEKAMNKMQSEFKSDIDIEILLCPAGDPSDCLKSESKLKALRSILNDL